MQYTISGFGNLRYEGRPFRVAPGEALLLLVPHNHAYWAEDGDAWEFFWLSMTGSEAFRIQNEILAATGPIVRFNSRTVDILAECSRQLIEGAGETPGSASAIAYRALMAMYDDVFGPSASRAVIDSMMAPVLGHIAANLARDLSVAELAAVAGLSRAHFTRVFTASEGVPPAEYVMAERMRVAARLLSANPEISIKEVSGLTGFDSQSYFSKVFRKTFGASPNEFRTTGMYASIPRSA